MISAVATAWSHERLLLTDMSEIRIAVIVKGEFYAREAEKEARRRKKGKYVTNTCSSHTL